MAKKRKFEEGGDVDNYNPDQDMADTLSTESFGEAFKRNRAGGNKTFEWRGKKYTTEMAKPKPKAEASKPAPKPKSDLRSGAQKDLDWMKGARARREAASSGMKKGGSVKKYARGGGIESRGKTRGRIV